MAIDAKSVAQLREMTGAGMMAAKSALAAMAEGDTLRTLLAALRRVMKSSPDGYTLTDAPGAVLTDDPAEAVAGANAVYADVWVSMGDEDTADERRRDLEPYRIDDALLAKAAPGAIALHCLPAHPGEEITSDVLYGERQPLMISQGRVFADDTSGVFEAVLGADVARRLGYTLGQQVVLSHGDGTFDAGQVGLGVVDPDRGEETGGLDLDRGGLLRGRGTRQGAAGRPAPASAWPTSATPTRASFPEACSNEWHSAAC